MQSIHLLHHSQQSQQEHFNSRGFMIKIIVNYLGLFMFLWYAGFRWNFCSKEPWISNPINLITALLSILFLVPAVFCPSVVNAFQFFHQLFFCLAVFLLFRNFYYAVEDVIDYISVRTPRQLTYIVVDVMMFIYMLYWVIQYNRGLLK